MQRIMLSILVALLLACGTVSLKNTVLAQAGSSTHQVVAWGATPSPPTPWRK